MRDILVIIGSLIVLAPIFFSFSSLFSLIGGLFFLTGSFTSDEKSNIKVVSVGFILLFFSPLIGLVTMLVGTYLIT